MELTKTPSFSLNQSRTEGIIGSPSHKMCSRFHMPHLTRGQSGQQPESRHLNVFRIMLSIYWLITRHCSSLPQMDASGNNGFHVFPRRVSCFPIWGFMFSLAGFHVFPFCANSMSVCLRNAGTTDFEHARRTHCVLDLT